MPPAPRPTCDDPFHLSHHTVGPFNVVHNRYPAGYRLTEHEHEVATIYLVVRGSHVEQATSTAVDCATGAVVFSPQGARHSDSYGTAGGEAFLIETPLQVMQTLRDAGVRADEPRHVPFGRVTPLMQRLQAEVACADDVTPFAFEALLLHVLAVLHRRPAAGTRIPPWLARTRELIHDRFDQRLTLAELAAAAGVHPVHLSTMFHRRYGMTFGAYLRQLRVEHARRALLATDKTVAEIALDCGFSDQSHLSRAFRETTGMSPGSFRRTARG
jgi:AraC family transcriptional regulator